MTATVTVIERLITELVQEAPILDQDKYAALVLELRQNGAPLALSIARVCEILATGGIDPGVALPALAMACGTLVDPRLTDREHEAARFEIETLLPVPGARPTPIAPAPDVPLAQLVRARRS